MNLSSDAYEISRWRAEFVDPALEQSYRLHIEAPTARHLRSAVVIWAILLLIFAPLDLAGLGFTSSFYLLLVMRVVQASLLFGLALMLRRRPQMATDGWPVTILQILGLPMFWVIFFVNPDIFATNLGVILILLISMYVFVPNRVILTSVTATIAITGCLLSFFLLGLTGLQIATLVPVLLLPAITGFIAAHRVQLLQRQEFVLLTREERTNAALLEEIRRREALEAELERQASTDPLTGLPNRRQYEALFLRERERCSRHGSRMVLGILDLDHFKQINDSYGHQLGDQLLCHVANVLSEPLRQTDVLGRFGGEEFILILPDTSEEEAARVVERLRHRLESSPMMWHGQKIPVTATFAVTEVRKEDVNIADTIRRADGALYLGKQAGRNRVMMSA